MQAVLFSSTSQLDAIQVIEKQKWEHSSCPADINVGDVIYVIPNKVQQLLYGDSTIVAKGRVVKVEKGVQGEQWASNLVNKSPQQYVCSVQLRDVSLIKLTEVKDFLMNGRFGPKGIRYIDLVGKGDK